MLRKLIYFLLLFPLAGYAQKSDSTAIRKVDSVWQSIGKEGAGQTSQLPDSLRKPGKITIIEDERIKKLEERYDESFELTGFRVQIFSGSDRNTAKETRSEFIKSQPEVKAYEIYQQPNFKIRVGNFRHRLQAEKFLNEIKANFPGAFIVPEKLEFEIEKEEKKEEKEE